MTNHQHSVGPSCFRDIEERHQKFTTLPRSLSVRVKKGELLTITERVPLKGPTGWAMDCLITHVASYVTMPGIFERGVVAVSLDVIEVYRTDRMNITKAIIHD